MRKMLSRFMAGFICSVMMFTTFGSDLSAAAKTLALTESDHHDHCSCEDETCSDSDHHVQTACADEACLEEGLSESGLFSILGIDRLMNSGLDGSDIKIAIFDTGIQSNQVNIAGAVSFVEDTTISNDHGTRMAETLAVIAPQADLYDVRILDDNGEGKYSDIARGIDWAIENDIQIIALSVEGFEESDILAEALEKAEANNILVIAAAGNQGSNQASYPAAYPQVISVGALNASGEIASYSNYGDQVDVFAPGVGIGDSCEPGTSYSVQYIAAVAALLWSADATLSGAEIRNLITASVSDGRFNAAQAYANLAIGNYAAEKTETTISSGFDIDGTVYAAACSHSYVLASTTSPTCTAQGYQTYRCYKCGVTQKRNYVSAKGHSYYNVTTSATCTNAATCTTKCNRCSYSNTIITSGALGHSYTVLLSTTPKTCTAQGYSTYRCSRCSATQVRDYVAAGHSYYNVTASATCTNAATCTTKCYGCSYSNTIVTSGALGHSYTVLLSKTPRTCTAQGYSTYRCSRCSATQKRDYVAAGHSYYNVTASATCTNAATCTTKCYGCSYSNTIVTSGALGHSYTVLLSKTPRTCTAQGYSKYRCSRCSATQKRDYVAAGHSYYNVTTSATCTNAATCTTKCNRCSYSNTIVTSGALGHSYTVLLSKTPRTCTAQGYSTYRCSRCSATQKRDYVAAGHDTYTEVVNATCTSAGSSTLKCHACSYSNTYTPIPALGHNYTVFVSTTPKTCTTDGYSIYKCSRCSSTIKKDYVEATGHDTYTVVVDPTCTSAGSSTLKCHACSYSNTYTPIPALGHNYGTWVVTREATPEVNGLKESTCSRCGVKSTIEIEPVIISTTTIDFSNISEYGEMPYIIFDYSPDWQISISSEAKEWLHWYVTGDVFYKIFAEINSSPYEREGSVYVKTADGYQVYNVTQSGAEMIQVENVIDFNKIKKALKEAGKLELLYGPGTSGICQIPGSTEYCIIENEFDYYTYKFIPHYLIFNITVNPPTNQTLGIDSTITVVSGTGDLYICAYPGKPIVSTSLPEDNPDLIYYSDFQIDLEDPTSGEADGLDIASKVLSVSSIVTGTASTISGNPILATISKMCSIANLGIGFIKEPKVLPNIGAVQRITFTASYWEDAARTIAMTKATRKVQAETKSKLVHTGDKIYMYSRVVAAVAEKDLFPIYGDRSLQNSVSFKVVSDITGNVIGSYDVEKPYGYTRNSEGEFTNSN